MFYVLFKNQGPNPLIFGIKEGYVADVTKLKLVPHVEQLVQTQYPIKIPTCGLEQPNLIYKSAPIQYTTTITLHVNIHVANGLPVHGNDVLFQQPKKVDSHPQLSGKLPRGSPNG